MTIVIIPSTVPKGMNMQRMQAITKLNIRLRRRRR
ncbi:MAG: hypothetical protein RIS54_2281 [Verrucomicrobiota bacterium]